MTISKTPFDRITSETRKRMARRRKQAMAHKTIQIAVAVLLCLASPAFSAVTPQASSSKSELVNDDSIETLIGRLSSESFAERQSAAQKIWERGTDALGPLQEAVKSADPEVAKRIQTVLNLLDIKVDANIPRGVSKMILYFTSGELEVKNQIIGNLRRQQQYELIFQLLARVPDEVQRRQMFDANINVPELIVDLAGKRDWDQIDKILRHPITWQGNVAMCAYHAQLNDELVPRIEKLKTSVANGTSGDRQLKRLITFLRIRRDIDGAIAYAKKLPNTETRKSLINNMLMEQGQWKTLLTNMVSPDGQDILPHEANTPNPNRFTATPAQQAIAAHFAGDQEQFDTKINQLIESANSRKLFGESVRQQAIDVMMACGKVKRALKLVAEEDELLKENNNEEVETSPVQQKLYLFQLFTNLQRFDDAFKAVGLGDNVQQRIEWVEENGAEIQRLIKKELEVKVRSAESGAASDLIRLSQFVAIQLGSIGLKQEAILHYRTLLDSLDDDFNESDSIRSQVVEQLMELAAYEEVWRVMQERISERDFWYLTEELFGARSNVADFWYKRIDTAVPDVLQRVNAIAHMVNSPLKRSDYEFDVQKFLDTIDSSQIAELKEDEAGDINYNIAMSHYYRGNQEAFEKHLRKAASIGHRGAIEFLAEKAEIAEDWQAAARLLDLLWDTDHMPYTAVRAARAYGMLGKQKQQKQRKLLALACWLENYRPDTLLEQFSTRNLDDDLQDILMLSVYGANDDGGSQDHYRGALSVAFANTDPRWSATNLKMITFLRFVVSQPQGGRAGLTSLPVFLGKADAHAELLDDHPQAAMKHMNELLAFRPGTIDVAEEFVPLLEEAGRNNEADQLFNLTSDFFLELLQKYPDSPIHNNNYAWLCATTGRRLDYATEHAMIAVANLPDNSNYLDTLAELQFLTGNKKAAIQLNRRCLQINPKPHYKRQAIRFAKE